MSFVVVAIAGSAATGLIGGIISSKAAGKAADAQVESADQAAILQKQAADDSLAFQKDVFKQQQENLEPWITAGKGALVNLTDYMKPGGELTKTYDSKQFYDDPGVKFGLDEAQKAIERSAAARGGALSGRAIKEASRYTTDYIGNQYGAAFDRFRANQTDLYNRTASIAGVGQQATNDLNSASQNYGNNASQITINSGNSQADSVTQAGNARASGYASQGNIWGNTMSQLGQLPMQYLMLSNLMKTK